MNEIYTIGFTEKNAEEFFRLLKTANANRIIDVRLNNVSQLAGFAKKNDLAFFLKEILDWKYEHRPELAPTKDILEAYKNHNGNWDVYEDQFNNLLEKRNVEIKIKPEEITGGVLLCSEHKPLFCHRRLVAEYLKRKWKTNIEIRHLF